MKFLCFFFIICDRHVAFVSSMAGQVGLFGFTAYSPSKFALRGLAETLAMELKPHGIGVTLVYPPDTDTPGYAVECQISPEETKLISGASSVASPESVARQMLNDIAARRFNSSIGFDGWILAVLTAGMAPLGARSFFDGIAQVSLGGALRLVGLVYRLTFDRTVSDCAKRRSTSSSGPEEEVERRSSNKRVHFDDTPESSDKKET